MECFITKDGVEKKADLEDIIMVINDDCWFQGFLIRAYYHKPYASKPNQRYYNFYLCNALAHLSDEAKTKIYRNMSPRLGGDLRKKISRAESFSKECDFDYQQDRSELIAYMGVGMSKYYTLPGIRWQETENSKKKKLSPVEALKKKIEDACYSGDLDMRYLCAISEEEMHNVFAGFKNRLDDLKHIHQLHIHKKDIDAAALLFEAGTIKELVIQDEYNAPWPLFMENCHTLTSLTLSGPYSEFPSWVRNAVSLHRLFILSFHITSIPDWVGELQSLKEIELYNNKNITSLPYSICNLKNLTKLNLSKTSIEKLPDGIGNLVNLIELDLCETPVEKLSDDIGNLVNLVRLDLCKTAVDKLPDNICNLKNLKYLDIRGLNIKEIPNDIGNLENLVNLYLDTPSIEKLPDSIGNLKKLVHLDISGSNIKELPDTIGNLQSLEELILQDNKNLTSLPSTIVNCASLELLDIFGTSIQSVPEFNHLVTIRNKDLIKMIPQSSVSYRDFVNAYYKLVEKIMQFSEKARREGLLALEEELEYLADDFFKQGIRLMVDGTDYVVIRHILTIRIEHEHDFYRKKLMEIAMEGILLIQSGELLSQIIIFLNSMVDIKDNPIDIACSKYLSGNSSAFSDMDFYSAIQEEEEREEIRFIKRAIILSEKSRREGFLALESALDHEGIAAHDVFEYGLPMIIDDYEHDFIDKILTNLITQESDPVKKNIALAKKDALFSINAGDSPRILPMKLLAYFDESITKEIEKEFPED